jgi:hypothetical protein
MVVIHGCRVTIQSVHRSKLSTTPGVRKKKGGVSRENIWKMVQDFGEIKNHEIKEKVK